MTKIAIKRISVYKRLSQIIVMKQNIFVPNWMKFQSHNIKGVYN